MGDCFDLSGFQGLSFSQAMNYKNDWNTYNYVQGINSNISTQRGLYGVKYQYYTFKDFAQKTSFLNGQSLHVRRYPNSNWAPVEQK
jgi:hypothetical protein